jgi:hypothetical protein
MENNKTTCQICGRSIKAKTGVIAHHGYKRPSGYGFQTASCLGARYLPYEVSADRIPEVIKMVQAFVDKTEREFEIFTENPPEKLIDKKYAGFGRYEKIEIEKPEGFKVSDCRGGNKMYSYEGAYAHYKYAFEQNIKMSKLQVEYMQERFDNWKEEV